MKWIQVKEAYPNQWVIVEVTEANTTLNNIRHIESVSVIDRYDNGTDAMNNYRKLHIKNPIKEYYFLHTSRNTLDIEEHKWLGVRCE